MVRNRAKPVYFFTDARLVLHTFIGVLLLTLFISWMDAAVMRQAALAGNAKVWNNDIEIPAHSDVPDTTSNEVQNEIKDFTAVTRTILFAALSAKVDYARQANCVFPPPLLNRHPPPPDLHS